MRRGVGVQRRKIKQQTKLAYEDKGKELTEANLAHISSQMKNFKSQLEEFARKRKSQISKDPLFRTQFQKLCSKLGIDPLASNKGFWAQILGVGDFYYELGIQSIHICLATRSINGGLISLDNLCKKLRKIRQSSGSKSGKDKVSVSDEDVERALKSLEPLGNGIKLVSQPGQRGKPSKKMVISVPVELSSDNLHVLQEAQERGYTNLKTLQSNLGWSRERADRATSTMVKEGMIWIDSQTSAIGEDDFWFPSLMTRSV
mmetsp:Transcript_16579/g.19323  ORF Transcript_16579/g.19323 Transcript_16579/m.19323 type:complete len:259 (-) Transcript_16579:286-1062(-)|eukprot:CAMPEP_0184026270 /NCGR_PEP_ID=MMETSP0954-20121128/13400_1 /TAXON_ID=627963 /ORGANISM="Aplanochytrium sp, Strain PBS07" /LENGTH=258 /DNA_ID=CAMNT_0026310401 /DNA_START=118 /DNA_END=894 /DNA_ORIENTATION=-